MLSVQFREVGKRQQQVCCAPCCVQLPAGGDICEAGDMADCLWILHEGSVAAVDANGIETTVTTAPALLGETALLQELDDQHHFRPCALR